MRMLMLAKLPHDEFNDLVDDGVAGEKLQEVLEATRPETVFFTELDGQRAAVMTVQLEEAAQIPSLAEPWFLTFNADVEFKIAMTPEDLKRSGLDKLGERWT